eukprot:TRINITY_DN43764_c0_g1_i1.p1 TRINITY_DN43764_c0_g1~~TRINITY_DN43764_c0_g1_i1.p1  ORF type:complete len:499 (+),score=136.83 TRINITY_DN43764_c0_g1_i1:112-1608(+)
MGSGASSSIQESLQDSSVHKLRTVWEAVPAQSREKLLRALESVPASREDSQSALQKAFQVLLESMEKSLAAAMSGVEADEEQLIALDAEYKRLLTDAFACHDVNSTRLLEKEEATVFFSHLLAERTAFAQAMYAGIAHTMLKNMKDDIKKALVETGGEETALRNLPKACRALEEEFEKSEDKLRAALAERDADYHKNKAEKDAAAMLLADVGGDGCLCLDEFLKMMDPAEDVCTQFMETLGIYYDPVDVMTEMVDMESVERQLEHIGKQIALQEALKGSAPYLRKAFDVSLEAALVGLQASMEGREVDETKISNLRTEYRDWLRHAFMYHDTTGTGKLDKDITEIFFSNLLSEGCGFMECMFQTVTGKIMYAMKQSIAQQLEMLGGEEAVRALPLACRALKAEFKKAKREFKAKRAQVVDDYEANKPQRDAEALKLADTDGNGNLDLEEFLRMMDPSDPVNGSLCKIIGLSFDAEAMIATIDMEVVVKKLEEIMLHHS